MNSDSKNKAGCLLTRGLFPPEAGCFRGGRISPTDGFVPAEGGIFFVILPERDRETNLKFR